MIRPSRLAGATAARLLGAAFLAAAAAACSDSTAPETAGPPTTLIVAQGSTSGGIKALAGTALTTPVSLRVLDANGRGVKGQVVNFAVTAGGGSLAAATATTDANGTVTLPAWTLGKSAVPQTVHATSGSFSTDVNATVQSDYNIDVRFFGDPMTQAQKDLFTNAAARIRGIVTGDVIAVNATDPTDLATTCGVTGLPTISEQIDDVVIYAAVQKIDGPGHVLAQAGPCLVRTAQYNRLTVVGVMSFDVDDLNQLANGGRLQDVITHEMLHVLGVGTLWNTRGFLADTTSEAPNNPIYTGSAAASACLSMSGSAVCTSTSVPVENTGGAGTRLGHWRESTFDTELMTGFAEQRGDMPISLMTIGSLEDLGYKVNRQANDPYTVPSTAAVSGKVAAEPKEAWESELPLDLWSISPSGRKELLRRGAQRVP